MPIAEFSIDLNANLAKFEAGMNRAAKISEDQAKRIDAAMSGLKSTIEGLGIAALVASQINGVKAAIDTLDKLDDLSEKFGIAAKDLSAYRYASEVAGTSTEAFAQGLNLLSRNMAAAAGGSKEQAAAFKAVGVSVKDANGKLRSADDVLLDLADRFSSYEDGAGKAALAQDVFGKSGAELIPLLNKGRDGITELRTEAEKLGAVYGSDVAKAAGDFNDNLTKLKLAAEGAKVSIAGDLLPALVDLTNTFIKARVDGLGPFQASLVTIGKVFAAGLGFDDVGKLQKDAEALQNSMTVTMGHIDKLQTVIANNPNSDAANKARASITVLRQQLEALQTQATKSSTALQVLADQKKFGDQPITIDKGTRKPPIPDKAVAVVDQAAKLYAELKTRIQEKIDAQQLEATTGEKVTEQQRFAIEVMARLQDGHVKLNAAQKAGLKAQLDFLVRTADANDQRAEATKRIQAETMALAAVTEKRLTDNKALQDAVEEIGLSRDQLDALTQQRLRDKLAIEDQAIATAKLTGANQASIDLMAINADALRQEIALRQQAAQKQAQLRQDPAAGAKQALDEYLERVKDVGTSTKDLVSNQLSGLEDNLANFFVTGKADWKSYFQSIAIEAAKINIVRPLLAQLSQVESAAGSGGGFLSLIGKFAGLFGGGSSSTVGLSQSIDRLYPSAKGNVFTAAGITKFARGDIFDSPTLFKFAKGTGVMGEAGPEAIMPLRRGADGKLGVAAPAAGGKTTIINQTTGRVDQVVERTLSDGERVILLQEMRTAVAADFSDPNSKISKSYGKAYKAERIRQ